MGVCFPASIGSWGAIQSVTSRIRTPAEANRAVRLHLLTAPEIAWEVLFLVRLVGAVR